MDALPYTFPKVRILLGHSIASVLTIYSTSLCDGLPFHVIEEPKLSGRGHFLDYIKDPLLLCRYRCHKILSSAILTITRSIDMEGSDDGGLVSLINLFEAQIQNERAPSDNDMCMILLRTRAGMHSFDLLVSSGSLTQNCTSLSILAFYFFVRPEKLRSLGLLTLFSQATNTLDLAARLDAAHDFSKCSTSYYLRIISLASFCMIRILRSSFKEHINIRDAEQSLFKAINFLKKRSIEHGDLDERYGIILTQLWSNSTKPEEMVDGLHFEIRSRSVGLLSVVM
jgi:hypothetical protein